MWKSCIYNVVDASFCTSTMMVVGVNWRMLRITHVLNCFYCRGAAANTVTPEKTQIILKVQRASLWNIILRRCGGLNRTRRQALNIPRRHPGRKRTIRPQENTHTHFRIEVTAFNHTLRQRKTDNKHEFCQSWTELHSALIMVDLPVCHMGVRHF